MKTIKSAIVKLLCYSLMNFMLPAQIEVHHNLIIGNYGAAVWSWTAAEDFKQG